MLVEGCDEPVAPSLTRGLSVPSDRRAARERLEAADVPASTDDRGVVDNLDVPDVAGAALRTAVDPPVRDDPGADAGPDLHDDDVVVADGDPRAPLAEREDVHIVVDPDGGRVSRHEPLSNR